MTPEQTVRELRAVQKKYEKVRVNTFDVNISSMAKDSADVIEDLLKKQSMNDYQVLAYRTASDKSKEQPLLNAALGLSGESGEFAEHIKKHFFQGHPIDETYLKKELGDICWYVALAATGMGEEFSQILIDNIVKLTGRYPDGFDESRSLNRVDK